MPADQLRLLRELGAAIKWQKRQIDMINNEKKYICLDIVLDIIVEKAADDLFNTPVASEIPSDSFEDDYNPDFFKEDVEAHRIQEEIERKKKEERRKQREKERRAAKKVRINLQHSSNTNAKRRGRSR